MGVQWVAIVVMSAVVLPACVRAGSEPTTPRTPGLAVAKCYEVTIHFDSAGIQVLTRATRGGIHARDVHPDSSGLGGGHPVWIDTLNLEARASRNDTADARGVHYQLKRNGWTRAWWQVRQDTVWVVMSDAFVYTRDSLLAQRDELHGVRTYATDGMEVYYASLQYRPLGLRCPWSRAHAS